MLELARGVAVGGAANASKTTRPIPISARFKGANPIRRRSHVHASVRCGGSAESRYIEWRAVSVAQLVELLVVVQAVAGSNPVAHPKGLQIGTF